MGLYTNSGSFFKVKFHGNITWQCWSFWAAISELLSLRTLACIHCDECFIWEVNKYMTIYIPVSSVWVLYSRSGWDTPSLDTATLGHNYISWLHKLKKPGMYWSRTQLSPTYKSSTSTLPPDEHIHVLIIT